MPTLSAKTARARASLQTSAHNNGLVKQNGNGAATLRAKEKHAHPSQQQTSFTLHGVHRTTPGIGRLYHHTPTHTLFKGSLPRGHGGHHGSYKVSVCGGGAPQRCASNDDGAAQFASVSHHADLHARHAKGYHGHYPNRWVQKMRGHQDAQEYIFNLTKKAVCLNQDVIQWKLSDFGCDGKCLKCETTRDPTCCPPGTAALDPHMQQRRFRPAPQRKLRANDSNLLFKLLNAEVMPQGQYIKTRYMRKVNLPTPEDRQHWPTERLGAAGCGSSGAFAKTWQEAQAMGHLRPTYRPYV